VGLQVGLLCSDTSCFLSILYDKGELKCSHKTENNVTLLFSNRGISNSLLVDFPFYNTFYYRTFPE